jgi:hypothetical protein
LVVHLLKVLILKLLSIDALASRAISLGEVSTLYHERFYDAVEERTLVVERLASFADAGRAGTEGAKVLGGFGDNCVARSAWMILACVAPRVSI